MYKALGLTPSIAQKEFKKKLVEITEDAEELILKLWTRKGQAGWMSGEEGGGEAVPFRTQGHM